jgi:threonyl-tRNA synthetase
MISLKFPDGSVREYEAGTSGFDVAGSIAKSLQKKAVAVMLDGQLADLADPINEDADFRIITRTDPEALELIRHDTCPRPRRGRAGTVSRDPGDHRSGHRKRVLLRFLSRDEPFHLRGSAEKIEARMREIIARNKPFTKEVWSARGDEAEVFKSEG